MQSKEKFKIQDHLHTRGEYSEAIRPTGKDSGSPPHTWRIQPADANAAGQRRITSTHVENTVRLFPGSRLWRDHLHTRGEYQQNNLDQFPFEGSPPHTWRIQYASSINAPTLRITSTHVENTLFWLSCLNH